MTEFSEEKVQAAVHGLRQERARQESLCAERLSPAPAGITRTECKQALLRCCGASNCLGAMCGPAAPPPPEPPVSGRRENLAFSEQQRAKLMALLAPKMDHLLPPELVSHVITFWAHLGWT